MNLKANQVLIPSTILYGPNCLENLGNKVKFLGKKALIVTDTVMTQIGYVDKVKKLLMGQNIDFSLFDTIDVEPTTTFIDEGLEIYKKENCDFLVAIGGGSPIDAAKAIGVMATNPGKISDYMGIGKISNPIPPIVAIATTSGTGSEVTQFTIIADVENDVKMLIGSTYVMPTIAVNDPVLTLSVPAKITAATGVDAFCHAIEAYISVKSQPFSDNMALSAIGRISKYLRKAWENGNDLEARSEMMLAAMEAGVAFSNSSVTIVHGMSRPIGANFHIPHGISNAVLLPACMEFAMTGAPERFAKVAEVMGEDIAGLNTMDAAKKALNAINSLCKDIQIPTILGLGINEEQFLNLTDKMAEDALKSGSPGNTPRTVTKEDIIELYKKCL